MLKDAFSSPQEEPERHAPYMQVHEKSRWCLFSSLFFHIKYFFPPEFVIFPRSGSIVILIFFSGLNQFPPFFVILVVFIFLTDTRVFYFFHWSGVWLILNPCFSS